MQRLERLGPREMQVLRLIGEGMTSKRIADKLGIAHSTAVAHRRNIARKLNCKGMASLVAMAVKSKPVVKADLIPELVAIRDRLNSILARI